MNDKPNVIMLNDKTARATDGGRGRRFCPGMSVANAKTKLTDGRP